MPSVIDHSVVSACYLTNHATAFNQALAEWLQDDRAWAPAVCEPELANLLRTGCLHQRLTAQSAQAILGHLSTLPIDIDRDPVAPSEMSALTLRLGLSSGEAAYLEWALRRQLPIATQDADLRSSALAAGVGLVHG
jgi:predicted nucleic acid-binding protein